jgi:DNA topoisomerase VI subunit A
LRGETPKSVFVQELIEKEKRRREREAFYRKAVAAYTPEVQAETLELNEATPFATE